MVQIGLRVPESTHELLQRLAESDDRSVAAYVRRIVERAIGIEPPPPPAARRATAKRAK